VTDICHGYYTSSLPSIALRGSAGDVGLLSLWLYGGRRRGAVLPKVTNGPTMNRSANTE
jgi:hypothetical protein